MLNENKTQSRTWALVLILLFLAAAELLARGPVRFAQASDFNDFISPYIQTRAWMKAIDPYSAANMVALWPTDTRQPDFIKKDLADGSLLTKRGIPTAYPPTAFPLLALFAWLPWRAAHVAWLVASLLACLLTPFWLASSKGASWTEAKTYLFVAFSLALAPFHTGLAAGSIVIIVVGACAFALWAISQDRTLLGGLLIAFAVGLKPQIGLPFLVYYLLRRRWAVVVPAAATLCLLFAIAILRLSAGHAPWLASYLHDNSVLLSYGSLGDFTEANPIRFGLINLQVLTYAISGNRMVANVAAVLLSAGLGIAWLLSLRRENKRTSNHDLLELATLLVISLLPIYHRFYDASVLVFPLALAWTAWPGASKPLRRGIVCLILIFLIPGGSLLERFRATDHLHWIQDSWLWSCLVMPHQVWALLGLSALLLFAMRRPYLINDVNQV